MIESHRTEVPIAALNEATPGVVNVLNEVCEKYGLMDTPDQIAFLHVFALHILLLNMKGAEQVGANFEEMKQQAIDFIKKSKTDHFITNETEH